MIYIRVREFLLDVFKIVGVDFKEYGLYSLRSGGVIIVVNNNVLDRFFKVYGRWCLENVKDGYVLDSINEKLFVILNFGLWYF